jgi:hypothetical protein
MKKLITFLTSIFLFLFVPIFPAYAQCPVCTLAVGAGLGLSRYLGIDDAVSGIWAGAFVISFSLWFAGWLKKKNYKFLKFIKEKYLTYLSVIAWALLTYIPLWKAGIIGHPFNIIWGIDKLIFGSVVGAGVFLLSLYADRKVRKIKGGKLFSFQKVIIPVSFLTAASLLMFFYGGYLR